MHPSLYRRESAGPQAGGHHHTLATAYSPRKTPPAHCEYQETRCSYLHLDALPARLRTPSIRVRLQTFRTRSQDAVIPTAANPTDSGFITAPQKPSLRLRNGLLTHPTQYRHTRIRRSSMWNHPLSARPLLPCHAGKRTYPPNRRPICHYGIQPYGPTTPYCVFF